MSARLACRGLGLRRFALGIPEAIGLRLAAALDHVPSEFHVFLSYRVATDADVAQAPTAEPTPEPTSEPTAEPTSEPTENA